MPLFLFSLHGVKKIMTIIYSVLFCMSSLCHGQVVPDIAGRPRVYLDIAIDATPVGRIATRISPVLAVGIQGVELAVGIQGVEYV